MLGNEPFDDETFSNEKFITSLRTVMLHKCVLHYLYPAKFSYICCWWLLQRYISDIASIKLLS